jgi:hypothetical protein
MNIKFLISLIQFYMEYLNSFVISKNVFMTMKLPRKVLYAFLILIFFSGSLLSQQQLSHLKIRSIFMYWIILLKWRPVILFL